MPKDLKDELKELQQRIAELERMLSVALQPLQNVSRTTQQYLRIVNLLLEHGGLTPDLILPDLKDPISRDIVRVLIDKPDQNISQITERVKSKRGTASRRIIRAKLKELTENHIVEASLLGSRTVYHLTTEVMKKWSQLLGSPI
ncbi:MAG: hypothetical protein JXA00_02620 [Candidatus Thermoplasmatota archaeon]|nr:hypothetical protein [Candidatus Thermoplasmatota archaeon]